MNIWIIANADFPNGRGGTPRIRNIAAGMVNRGHVVRVLIPHAAGYVGKNQNTDVKGVYNGVEFEYLNNSVERPQHERHIVIDKIVGHLKMLWKLAMEKRPDCIVIYNYSLFDTGLVIFLAKLLKVVVLYDVCDERFDIHARGWDRSLMRNINIVNAKISDTILFPLADGYFVVSTYLQKKIKKYSDRQPVIMLPLIADIHYQPATAVQDTNVFQLAYLGSLIPDEGIEILVDAIAIIKKEIPNIHCDITGGANNASYEREIRKRIQANALEDTISLVPNIPHDQVVQYLMGKTLLLLPRPNTVISQAGFPGKLAEYISSRRPFVATNFSDILLYFKDNESAFISENNSASSFASSCMYALRNPDLAKKVAHNAFQVGLEKFDMKILSSEIEKFILHLKN